MGSLRIVPLDPAGDGPPGLGQVPEAMLPDTLLLERAEEPFDHAVLLRAVRGDEFLGKAILTASSTKSPRLKDKAVVTANDWGFTLRSEGTKPSQTCFFQCHFRFPSSSPERELVSDDLTVVTIDDRSKMTPTIPAAREVSDVHGPALVAPLGATPPFFHSGTRSAASLMNEPPLESEQPIDRLAINPESFTKSKKSPQPAIAVGGMLVD